MGLLKGQKEYDRFKQGHSLTRKQAMNAHCYECNGFEYADCQGSNCPMYQYSPYNLGNKRFSQRSIPAIKEQ